MCGFLTVIGQNLNSINKNFFFHAAKKNIHRGPNQQSYYFDKNILCTAQTLKITRKSKYSDQPYKSFDGRFIITFNGQIYNYLELINELKKDFNFKYGNELEVIEKLFIKFGKNFVNFLNGMFAISIWDIKNKRLCLFTDHFNIKPIYYTKYKNNWYFSSEIKDLKFLIPFSHFQEDENSVSKFLQYSIANDDKNTFYKNIKKFSYAQRAIFQNGTLIIDNYWDLKIENKQTPNYNELTKLFSKNFKLYSNASIKKSFSISSGLDSNFLLQQSIKDKNYNLDKDISVISNIKKYHNSEYKNNVNFFKNYPFKIDLYSDQKILEPKLLENLEYITEQPVHSSNIYISLLMRKYLKKKNYNILFTGHGADEIFGGYNRAFYDYMFELDQYKNKDLLLNFVNISQNYLGLTKAQILKRLKRQNENFNFNHNYFKFLKTYFKNDYLENFKFLNHTVYSKYERKNFLKFRLKQHIFKHDLPYTLTIEDKISMNNSIETRVPFLNKQLIESIFNIDSQFFLQNGKNKKILRTISKKLNHFQKWESTKSQLPGDNYLFLKKHINKTVLENLNDDIELNKIIKKKKIINEMKNLNKNEITKNFFIFRLLSYKRWKSQNV
ncbi:asparagine synthase-related protein [Candidatus Pelagibacter sp.]|nr:asparagine synthase-related protein [Candidatus Pelagibacter sp.]